MHFETKFMVKNVVLGLYQSLKLEDLSIYWLKKELKSKCCQLDKNSSSYHQTYFRVRSIVLVLHQSLKPVASQHNS